MRHRGQSLQVIRAFVLLAVLPLAFIMIAVLLTPAVQVDKPLVMTETLKGSLAFALMYLAGVRDDVRRVRESRERLGAAVHACHPHRERLSAARAMKWGDLLLAPPDKLPSMFAENAATHETCARVLADIGLALAPINDKAQPFDARVFSLVHKYNVLDTALARHSAEQSLASWNVFTASAGELLTHLDEFTPHGVTTPGGTVPGAPSNQ